MRNTCLRSLVYLIIETQHFDAQKIFESDLAIERESLVACLSSARRANLVFGRFAGRGILKATEASSSPGVTDCEINLGLPRASPPS